MVPPKSLLEIQEKTNKQNNKIPVPPLLEPHPNSWLAANFLGPGDSAPRDTAVRVGGDLLLGCGAKLATECFGGAPEPLAWVSRSARARCREMTGSTPPTPCCLGVSVPQGRRLRG